MSGRQKQWVGLVLGGGVLLALVVGLASRQQLPQVTATRAKRETLDSWISSNGKVEPLSPYVMRAQIDAFVKQVAVVEGQAVKRGQLLLELDANDADARLAQARQSLLAAEEDLRNARAGGSPEKVVQLETDLSKAQAQRDRLLQQQATLQRLVASRAATADELEQNKLELQRADADLALLQQRKKEMARQAALQSQQSSLRVQEIRDRVRDLQEKVNSARVISPVDGTLYSLSARPGQYIHVGETLLEMADLRRVWIRAFVDEPDLGWLEPNQLVEITWDAMPAQKWTGSTEQIPKQVVARGTRSIGEVVCSANNERLELLPNINVSVRIRVRQRENALVIARASVRGEGNDRYVFKVEGGRLRKQPVQLGIASATKYEVVQGLKEGDLVAIPGDFEFRDGMEVRVAEQS